MAKDTDAVRVICHSCEARYTVHVGWLDSAVEFECSCGARLKADIDDLFQVRHDMTNREITRRPIQEYAKEAIRQHSPPAARHLPTSNC